MPVPGSESANLFHKQKGHELIIELAIHDITIPLSASPLRLFFLLALCEQGKYQYQSVTTAVLLPGQWVSACSLVSVFLFGQQRDSVELFDNSGG